MKDLTHKSFWTYRAKNGNQEWQWSMWTIVCVWWLVFKYYHLWYWANLQLFQRNLPRWIRLCSWRATPSGMPGWWMMWISPQECLEKWWLVYSIYSWHMLESGIVVMNVKKIYPFETVPGEKFQSTNRDNPDCVLLFPSICLTLPCLIFILHQCLLVVKTFIVFLDRVLYFSYFLSLFWDSRCPGSQPWIAGGVCWTSVFRPHGSQIMGWRCTWLQLWPKNRQSNRFVGELKHRKPGSEG